MPANGPYTQGYRTSSAQYGTVNGVRIVRVGNNVFIDDRAVRSTQSIVGPTKIDPVPKTNIPPIPGAGFGRMPAWFRWARGPNPFSIVYEAAQWTDEYNRRRLGWDQPETMWYMPPQAAGYSGGGWQILCQGGNLPIDWVGFSTNYNVPPSCGGWPSGVAQLPFGTPVPAGSRQIWFVNGDILFGEVVDVWGRTNPEPATQFNPEPVPARMWPMIRPFWPPFSDPPPEVLFPPRVDPNPPLVPPVAFPNVAYEPNGPPTPLPPVTYRVPPGPRVKERKSTVAQAAARIVGAMSTATEYVDVIDAAFDSIAGDCSAGAKDQLGWQRTRGPNGGFKWSKPDKAAQTRIKAEAVYGCFGSIDLDAFLFNLVWTQLVEDYVYAQLGIKQRGPNVNFGRNTGANQLVGQAAFAGDAGEDDEAYNLPEVLSMAEAWARQQLQNVTGISFTPTPGSSATLEGGAAWFERLRAKWFGAG